MIGKKIRKAILNWLLKDGLPDVKIGEDPVIITGSHITLPGQTADPALAAGRIWVRSDLGLLSYSHDGSTIRRIPYGSINVDSHASRHASGGADAVSLDASQITSGRLSISRMPDGASGYFLKGQGAGVDPVYALLTADDIKSGRFTLDRMPLIGAQVFYVMSTTAVSTTSTSLVDDTPATLTFTLNADSYVLIIYNASCKYNESEYSNGKCGLINIDGNDILSTRVEQAPYTTNYPNGFTSIYVGELLAGSHTVKGRFASHTSGYYAVISQRQLLVIAIPKSAGFMGGVSSTTLATTTSTSLVDDPYASYTFSLPLNMWAIMFYNATCSFSSCDGAYGKYGAINVDGADYTESYGGQSTTYCANSITCFHYKPLSYGSHTINGRFASNYSGYTAKIDRRYLGVIAVPDQFYVYAKESTNTVQTTSTTPVDDSEAILTVNLPCDCLAVVVYNASNHNGATEDYKGKYGLINVDGSDQAASRADQSPLGTNCANSFVSVWCGYLAAGSHTVKGRFASISGNTVSVTRRQIIALCIPTHYLL